MLIPIIVFSLIIAVTLRWKTIHQHRFSNQVRYLFASLESDRKVFEESQLVDLPQPVQRYFRHVLKNGQAYVKTVKLTHDGWFKTGAHKAWTAISGVEYFTTNTPGFIWKGKTAQFTAIDRYIEGKGRLQVFLLSLIRIVNASGKKYDQGELSRWLSESVWFPTTLLPSENLSWVAINATTARLLFNANGRSIQFLVSFNAMDEMAEMETSRFMGDGKTETWVTKMTNYQELNGIKIPMRAEALWRLADGDFSYARFHVKTIQYNVTT